MTVFGLLVPDDLPDRPRLVTDRQFADACARMQHEQLAGIRDHDVPVITRIESGDPAPKLVSAARNADLLVVGARGHGGISGLLLGSVSLHCAQRATCPVTVVPAYVPDAEPGAPVVVGVDGSPASKAALHVAAQEATLRDTHVVAVHAVHWPTLGTDLIRPSDEQLVDWGTHLLTGVITPGAGRLAGRPSTNGSCQDTPRTSSTPPPRPQTCSLSAPAVTASSPACCSGPSASTC